MKRTVDYSWRLREVMAEHGMYATTDLVPLRRARYRFDGLPEPDRPQGYAVTIVLGQLLLHGVRNTRAPGLLQSHQC